MGERETVVIASPLEAHLVDRIRAVSDRIDVIHEPELLPAPRYAGDHGGAPPDLDRDGLARWQATLARADILFDFDWHDPAALPRTAPALRWVQATSSGIGEFLVRTGLDHSDIQFTTAAGVHGVALAEFVALGLLYFNKQVADLVRRQREHHWQRYTARRLAGTRVLLIGLGSVGSTIARHLHGLGVIVTGMARTGRAAPPEGVARLIVRDELTAALSEVDALVLACPYSPATHHLIGARELEALPSGAILVNVARGSVVDEAALVAALAAGRIGGAWLDVFEEEPLPSTSPLWDLPNVVVSPHSASTVDGENELIVGIFVDNIARWLEGRPLRNRFDVERGY